MPKNRICILSTAALDHEIISEAEMKGTSVDVLPFIKTEPISLPERQQAVNDVSRFAATAVFTSANAVEAVVSCLRGSPPEWKIFCTSGATARDVDTYFGKKSIAGIGDNAAELAQLIVASGHSNVVFFCGNRRRNELPDLLKRNNIAVKEVTVYETAVTPFLMEKKYDAILFFSPSAVESFFQKNQVSQQTVLFAIGHTTANEIRSVLAVGNMGNKIIVGNQPDKKMLLEDAVHYFQINQIRH